ncbi:MAG: hypothetical protein HYX79_10055 [Chloroflexi bacterium]|nr:hypothetical protein [Chloroflexota bacterium]
MPIEWFRDVVISIFAIVATVVLILLAVVSISCYRRIAPLIDSARNVARTVECASARFENEILLPLIEVAAFVRMLCQLIKGMKKFFKAKTGGSDEPERK